MGHSSPGSVLTKLQWIAKLARRVPKMVLMTLAHHIDMEFLKEAFRRTNKKGAVGVDGQTAEEYEKNLEGNLESLLQRFKSGTYYAPPVRRVYIPKPDKPGEERALGVPIPTANCPCVQVGALGIGGHHAADTPTGWPVCSRGWT